MWRTWQRWAENTGASILAVVVLAFIPGGVVGYLSKIQSEWTKPILLGLGAWALGAFIVLAMDAVRRLPPRRPIPDLSNIESLVRDWLDRFGVGVKRDPVPTAFFRFFVTLGSGTSLYVGRGREGISDYLLFRADLAPTTKQVESIEALSEKNKLRLLYRIRLELSRARLGYDGLHLPVAKNFNISKRVPIRETLTEHEFMQAIDEMEAGIITTVLAFETGLIELGEGVPDAKLPPHVTIEG